MGAAVSVYLHGEKVVDLWGGVADPEEARPWRRDTLQAVYSTTKGATAACALLLAQRGELDLDAPVADHWPEFAAAGKQDIPVRWLLSHRAGLPTVDLPVPLADALAWEPVAEALAAQRPLWTPGAEHGYHALTFGRLVGEVVRRVSGRGLGAFFRTEIAEPLDLDFWIGLPKSEHHRVSRIIEPKADPDAMAALNLDPLPEPMRDIMTAYTDPTSLTSRAYSFVEPRPDNNDPDVLAAEVPDRILRVPVRWSTGYALYTDQSPWLPETMFGFSGLGGSIGFADPHTGLAFGYVMNHLSSGMAPDPRAEKLVTAVRACHAALLP